MSNFFKKIQPIKDALKNADPNRKNAFNSLTEQQLKDNIGSNDTISILDSNLKRIKSNIEKVVDRSHNSFIILGKDREHIRNSGEYSITGRLDTNSIDLCTGLGYNPDSTVQKNKYTDGVNPDFIHDKSRVYISEGCNVDSYFGIQNYGTKENNTSTTKLLSSIVIKSDTIRAISRTNIKLITGRVDTEQTKANTSDGGIELISINGSKELQPMVLGNNLIIALSNLINHINNLQEIVSNHIKQQMIWDTVMANHVHLNTFPNTPDPNAYSNIISKLVNQMQSIGKIEIDKINSGITKLSMESLSKQSILSDYHKLN